MLYIWLPVYLSQRSSGIVRGVRRHDAAELLRLKHVEETMVVERPSIRRVNKIHTRVIIILTIMYLLICKYL